MTSTIQKQMLASYFSMRTGTGVMGAAFPFVLWLGGKFYAGLPLQDCMSDYYIAAINGRSMRDWFVGILFAVGTSLFLYKGFSVREDIALNMAGASAVGVAIFPEPCSCGSSCGWFSIHGACAIVLFLCMAFVAVFCADDTLQFIADPKVRAKYKRSYMVVGVLMVASPLIAWAIKNIFHEQKEFLFYVEAGGIFAFAAYWFVKSEELSLTQIEKRALRGELESAA